MAMIVPVGSQGPTTPHSLAELVAKQANEESRV